MTNRYVIMAGVTLWMAATASAQTKPPQVGENSATCLATFSSGAGATYLSFCITQTGNVLQLQSPAGVTHISSEGYAACSSFDPSNIAPLPVAYDAAYFEANWGAPTITQPSGPNTFPLTIVRLSTGGLRLTQTFTRDTAEHDITISMTLANVSGGVRYNVRLDRYIDGDANNMTANIYARTLDSVFAFVAAGRGLVLSDLTRTVSHTTAVHAFASWQRNVCNQATVATPTAAADHVGRMSFVLGTLNNNASKTVKINYRRF
jgi:hypothetical protein